MASRFFSRRWLGPSSRHRSQAERHRRVRAGRARIASGPAYGPARSARHRKAGHSDRSSDRSRVHDRAPRARMRSGRSCASECSGRVGGVPGCWSPGKPPRERLMSSSTRFFRMRPIAACFVIHEENCTARIAGALSTGARPTIRHCWRITTNVRMPGKRS